MSHYDANAFQLAAGRQTVVRCRRAGCVETVEICLFWFEKEDLSFNTSCQDGTVVVYSAWLHQLARKMHNEGFGCSLERSVEAV